MRVHFRYHERDLGVHPEGTGVVDDDGPGSRGCWGKFQGTVSAGREQGNIDPLEGIFGQQLNRQLLSPEGERFADGAFGGEQPQLFDRKILSLQHVQHGAANRSSGPGDRDRIFFFHRTHFHVLER